MISSAGRGRRGWCVPALVASSALVGGMVMASPAMADTDPAASVVPPDCDPDAEGGGDFLATSIDDAAQQGMVEVRSGSDDPVLIEPAEREEGQRFGADVVGKGMAEPIPNRTFIMVGAPGETVDGQENAGAVHVYLNTQDGVCQLDHLTLDDERLPGEAQAGARFGVSLDATSGSEDVYPHYAHIGAPGLDDDGVSAAGGVITAELASAQNGRELVIDDSELVTLSDVGAEPSPGAHFGATVMEAGSGWYAGAPGATVEGEEGAGLVAGGPSLSDEPEYEVFSQATEGMQGTPEAGDGFGSALTHSAPGQGDVGHLWIGVPGEDLGDIVDAGMVSSLRLEVGEPAVPGPSYTQNTPDDGTGNPVPGTAEAGDRFGAALGTVPVGEYDWDTSGVLVGVPGEDAQGLENVGAVTGLHGAPSFSQAGVGGELGEGNRFGAAVDRLSVGAPGTSGDSANGAAAVATSEDGELDWTLHTPSGDLDEGAAYGTSVHVNRFE